MVRHIVLWRLKPGGRDRFESLRDALEAQRGKIPGLVRVEVGRADLSREGIVAAFDRAYQAAFGRSLTGIAVRILNLRYARIGQRPKFDLALLAPTSTAMPDALGTQAVFHAGQWHDAVRYARLDLPVGAEVAGPAILEQPDTTIWIEPGFAGRVDSLGNLLIARNAS